MMLKMGSHVQPPPPPSAALGPYSHMQPYYPNYQIERKRSRTDSLDWQSELQSQTPTMPPTVTRN